MAPLGVLPVAEGARHQLVAAHVWFLTTGHANFWDSPAALPLSCSREPRCCAAVPRQPCTNGLKGRRRASGGVTEEPGAQHPPSGASAQDPRVLPWSTGVSLLCSCLCITSTTCTTVPGAPLGPRRMKQQHPWPTAPPKPQPPGCTARAAGGQGMILPGAVSPPPLLAEVTPQVPSTKKPPAERAMGARRVAPAAS